VRFFAQGPQDDVALLRSVQPAAARLAGALPESAWLAALAREHGVDFATAACYQALRAHPVHGSFASELESLPLPREGGAAGPVLIVPGLVWESYPELGADGALVLEVARRVGFAAERIPVSGRGTLTANAQTILRYLAGYPRRDAWLISVSKGSADLRFAMSGRFGAFPWDKFAGWVNLCGSPNGSDLAALLTSGWLRRLSARVLCLSSRIPFEAMLEISSQHPSWRGVAAPPTGFPVINIVAMPLRWHLSRMLEARHRMLSMLGPNDGVVLCANAFLSHGLIYPLWGHDHYFRGAGVVPLLYRLFAYLRAQRGALEGRRHFAT
jgi:hypothetical protein